MSEARDLPTIESSFAGKTILEEGTFPNREVDGEFTTQTIRDWLGHHGYPNGKRVSQVDIVSGAVNVETPEFYLVLKVWYHDPKHDRKFFMRPFAGDGEVAWERRMTPMLCLPGGEPGEGVTFEDIKAWVAPYGVGKRIARPIHLAEIPPVFSVTEWHVEDGKVGLRTTNIRGSFTLEETGEYGADALDRVKEAAAGARS